MFVITFFSANYITNITPRPQMAQPMQKQWYTQNVKKVLLALYNFLLQLKHQRKVTLPQVLSEDIYLLHALP